MEYRILGKTGFRVSKLSLGGSSLGGVYQKIDEKEAIKAVHTALDNGINLIDTAPAYGDLRAEMVLGKALKSIPRDRYFLSTKTGKYSSTHFDFSYERIMQEVDLSMKRLHVDYIDILNLHDFEFENGIHRKQALSEGYRALQDLKAQGRIGNIGIGIYFVDWCREIMYSHDIQSMICHNHYNLNDDRIDELLPDLKKTGVGLVNAGAMAAGLLSNRGPSHWHPIGPEDLKIFRKAVDFCHDAGTSIEKLAFQFALSHPEIPTTLVSTPESEQVLQNIEWLADDPDWELVHEVRKILKPVMNKDWIIG